MERETIIYEKNIIYNNYCNSTTHAHIERFFLNTVHFQVARKMIKIIVLPEEVMEAAYI